MDSIALFYSEGKTLDKEVVHCKNNEPMFSIFEKFSTKVGAKVNDFDFYYKGNKIKEDSTIISLKNDKIAKDIDISFKKSSKIMKCPECICNNCIIKVEKYRLNFSECCYDHKNTNVIFDRYEGSQNIEYNKIRCNKCQKSQSDDFKDFSKCLRCTKQFKYAIYYCYDCSLNHPHSKFLIKYDEKYYYCEDHFKLFQSYCSTCNTNLCDTCEKNHRTQNHRVLKYEQMAPNLKPIKENLEDIKLRIQDLKIVVDEIKSNMDGAVRIMEQYCDIAEDIIYKYESFNTKYTNFQVLQTVSFLQYSNFEVLKDLIEVTEGNLDLKEKCNMLIDIYKSDRSNYSNYSQPVSNNMSFENVTQLEMKEPESSQKKKREIHNQKSMEIGNNVKGNIGKKK
jgi:hypothetical protein